MLVNLSAVQARVIGVLLEKEVTTPEQYPLSLNGLTLGCNQKSSREPVMSLSESEVQQAVDELRDKRQVSENFGAGSRVTKYSHKFCNTEFGDLQLTQQELAIVCLLLLRGAQTPGELRSRSGRMADFANVQEVERVLNDMSELNGECLVKPLQREPGKREIRYVHLLSGDQEHLSAVEDNPSSNQHSLSIGDNQEQRIHALEQQVKALTEQVELLKADN